MTVSRLATTAGGIPTRATRAGNAIYSRWSICAGAREDASRKLPFLNAAAYLRAALSRGGAEDLHYSARWRWTTPGRFKGIIFNALTLRRGGSRILLPGVVKVTILASSY